ncbi:MAG TPA: aminotransferase class V-fold PLP-dependent enzyme [Thermoanaerobaculia bacterium]|nr:aminotransferase class V-fold PLP-dependent enzyme [Thermoanaerobaculia bacterium]
MTAPLEFRIAAEPWELEQIHRLNYVTFTEEIPQYAAEPSRRRVDRFHDENTYVISVSGERVVGMIALRFDRPFSVESKLAGFDSYLPRGRRFCELRLLAIERDFRGGGILAGLLREVWKYASARGFDAAVISATTRQLRLYEHLGFVPFGPLVGTDEAPFQPMLLTREAFVRHVGGVWGLAARDESGEKASFLPGPVAVHRDVAAAMAEGAVSHRSSEFAGELSAAREALRRLTSARHVQVLAGTGTLANDAVAAQIAGWGGAGLVLTNGEFGERLIDHARRFGLRFEIVRAEWGEAIDPERVREALDTSPAPRWLWMTACETSTGVLNDWSAVAEECRHRGTRLCLDAVSALGSVPLDLSGVDLATGVSGKGLGAYPGLAIVFHRDPIVPGDRIPRYLDLGLYAAERGVPFTQSSNLVRALRVALERAGRPAPFAARAELSTWLRSRLVAMGLRLVGAGATPAPQAITIELDPGCESPRVGAALAAEGFLVAWESGYLRSRNWIQIALMGEVNRAGAAALLRALRKVTATT